MVSAVAFSAIVGAGGMVEQGDDLARIDAGVGGYSGVEDRAQRQGHGDRIELAHLASRLALLEEPSRDELLAALRRDICRRLADDLAAQVAELPDDGVVRLFAICRAFRHWALAHRNEFTLVFASPSGGNPGTVRRFDESFGLVFLEAAGKVLAAYDLAPPPVESIPGALRTDLIAFQAELLALLAGSEQKFPAEKFDLGVAYLMMTVWVRLYGHVTLEVFGNYPMPVSDPDVLFDAVLTDLAAGIGLVAGDGG